ncbi:hypothetical protein FC83_GL000194 [Agrilactobacillus composti DSM 18527 = JCM 14202]|uniref:Surface layer protein A domain-containing protein n=1 Tax=Agrilactobacillus composti DSM 18527 = JCM 14202 TaxID=1423734 RepID=X0PRX0_9LACO|nr:hypothetical protein [Agrilactobacillus composti]KRM32794.1 hypothetical protein FC83_GL000194 [Agrilactobacillus composti DSM 18527 = JCM 14202]GAF40597.1 hypothetical protein JCM14202_2500 [Agrilactobacillus composti DSM 18527 = JCM 14202]
MKFKQFFVAILTAVTLATVGTLLIPQSEHHKVQAAFRTNDTFYAYNTVVTVDGIWGANLFTGNDGNKQFDRVLPKNSQWRTFGYTRRYDGYYYWLGGNQWVQANQVKIPVNNRWDAILNVVAKYGDIENSNYDIYGNTVDPEPWTDYGDGNKYMWVDETPIDWGASEYRSHLYQAYWDGSVEIAM